MKALEVFQGRRTEILTAWQPGLWRFQLPRGNLLVAGVTDRSGTLDAMRTQLAFATSVVQAEQIHGASVSVIESTHPPVNLIPGCDGLVTRVPGVVLVIRTADCLPLFLWDPVQRVVGLAHVGWRGLVRALPMRLMSALQMYASSRPQDVWVGIGPAIRACCYEVGEEFEQPFGSFVRHASGRRTCDLIGYATQQLFASGVRPSRVIDCGECTACEGSRWHSVRRDGETGGRLYSFIVIQP
jgi:YfiH family protein